MVLITGIGTLPLVGILILGATLVTVMLQSRNYLPFMLSEGVYTGISFGTVYLVTSFLVDSTWETIVILGVGRVWALRCRSRGRGGVLVRRRRPRVHDHVVGDVPDRCRERDRVHRGRRRVQVSRLR